MGYGPRCQSRREREGYNRDTPTNKAKRGVVIVIVPSIKARSLHSRRRMGIVESTDGHTKREDFIAKFDDDPTYPWLLILEYVSDRMPHGIVRTYDFNAVKSIVLETSRLPLLVTRGCRSTPLSVVPVAKARDLDSEEVEFATSLLQKDPRLEKMRYSYVPGTVTERQFWTIYFDRLYSRIREHLTRDSDPEDKMYSNDEKNADLLSLKNQFLRDIGASVSCPRFLENVQIHEIEKFLHFSPAEPINPKDWTDCMRWLRSLDDSPEECETLENWFSERSHTRLGDYWADCYEYYVTYSPLCNHYSKKVFAVQVHGNVGNGHKSTVGEFDALLLDGRSNVLHHQELSVKYLLCERWNEPGIGFQSFVGPHRSETMRDKVEKMKKQSALSEHPLAQQIIAEKIGTNSWTSIAPNCVLKGWLFYPLSPVDHSQPFAAEENLEADDDDVALVNVHNSKEILAGSPEHLYVPGAKASDRIFADDAFPMLRLNPSHWHGWWSRSPETIVSRFSFRKGHRWLLAPKLLWGSPVRVSANAGGLPERLVRLKNQQDQRLLFVTNDIEVDDAEASPQSDFHTKKSMGSPGKLLNDEQFIMAVHRHRKEALASEKYRMLRVLVVELLWDAYLKSWVEVSRGFCVEEEW